ncbi:MAG TPA: VCBS repeat-containing protein [Dongiaceae bacterium]|nr:VCBS repeat-containing protein [Dongiaceae bacterium]
MVLMTLGLVGPYRCLAGGQALAPPNAPKFERIIIDPTAEANAHKPKVLARFSREGGNDLGSLDRQGFKLYRAQENWKAYIIFEPGDPGGFEDAAVADINRDGWNDILLGGWGNRTLWAENPAGQGRDPYTNRWPVHVVDSSRFSHEICAADMDRDGRCDIITTSGIYFQGATPDAWIFISIGRGGQGTQVGNLLGNRDGYNDVIAVGQTNGGNQIVWFENPGHAGGDPIRGHWIAHVIDATPGAAENANRDMNEMAFALGDINGDGRPDVVAASMGEGPDAMDDPHQVGDGLVWYESPRDPRRDVWLKHVIAPGVAWVHASSIQLADFDGDGHLDICFAEQDQSSRRKDGQPSRQLGICYNVRGDAKTWKLQILSQYPAAGAGGFNSKVGLIGSDRLPSIFTSLHGYFGDANPLILWRNQGMAGNQDSSRSQR